MDKEESKFENKYFSSPLKKKEKRANRTTSVCLLFVSTVAQLSEALRNMDNILFWACSPQDPETPDKNPVEQYPFTVGRWVEDDNG